MNVTVQPGLIGSGRVKVERAWLEAVVFRLDRWLRRRLGIYEYSVHPQCLFRIQCVPADEAIEFAVRLSLRELARYLRERPGLADVSAVRGDMRITGEAQAERLGRILARFGFETAPGSADRRGVLHRFGDALLIVMLVLATNPRALREARRRRRNVRFIMSREVLEKRYGPARPSRPAGQRRAATAFVRGVQWVDQLPSARSAER
jgi:hypothetical protein